GPRPPANAPVRAVDAPDIPPASPARIGPAPPESKRPPSDRNPPAAATSGTTSLRLPIDGMDVDAVKGGFAERRGDRPHEAVDILAPRNTPVHAVQPGTIAKLFVSKQGGNTIYEFDPSGRLCYYYAHLERYAEGLHEGDAVSQGQVIGYVGTTINPPP